MYPVRSIYRPMNPSGSTYMGPDSEELLEYKDRTLSSTWTISPRQVSKLDADAAALFQFLAYFDNKDIWYELLRTDSAEQPDWLGRVTASKIRFDRAMMKLQDYSLIDGTAGTYSIHQCVHYWISAHFEVETTAFLATLNCIVSNIPEDNEKPEYWKITRRLLPHVNRLEDKQIRKLWGASASNEKLLDFGNALASLYYDWNHYDQAEKFYKQTLVGRELAYGRDHPSTLHAVNDLGLVYGRTGRPDQVEQMYKRVLAGFKDIGADKLSLGVLHNLVVLYIDQNKLDQAEEMFDQTMAGNEQFFGYDHPETLHTVRLFGELFRRRGKLDQAEEMHKRALAGFEQRLGRDHMSTLRAASDLGTTYHDQGKLDEAEQMLERALAGFEQAIGHDQPDTLDVANILGDLYCAQGKLDEAKKMYMRALDGFQSRYGPDDPRTRMGIYNLATLEDPGTLR